MVLIIRDSCSRSITDQVWNSSRPLAWLFRKADAFRVTWSEQVCVCEVVSDLSLKGIDREGLEKGRAETRPVKNISDHFSYGKRKLFMLKVAGLRETWKMTASVFLPDAKTKTSWPLETCSIKGCWFAMIVFCICVILHSLFIEWACRLFVFGHRFFPFRFCNAPLSHHAGNTLERKRELGRVTFRKEFWDCYWGQEKNWPIADRHVPNNDPKGLFQS